MFPATAPHQLSLLPMNAPGGRPARSPAPRTVASLAPSVPTPARTLHDALTDETRRATLERMLTLACRERIALSVTDNRRTMVSAHESSEGRRVRLHHMFLDAPSQVIEALGRFLARGDRLASQLIDRYIAGNETRIKPARPSAPARIVPSGSVHDLAAIQSELSGMYFDGTVALPITWGRHGASQSRRRARRTIRMGTYLLDEQLIRIHPALDQTFVPRYFVAWVVYHEMLHHVVPMPVVGGRKVYHSAEFRRREKLFHDYVRARRWEEENLTRLIATRRGAAR